MCEGISTLGSRPTIVFHLLELVSKRGKTVHNIRVPLDSVAKAVESSVTLLLFFPIHLQDHVVSCTAANGRTSFLVEVELLGLVYQCSVPSADLQPANHIQVKRSYLSYLHMHKRISM